MAYSVLVTMQVRDALEGAVIIEKRMMGGLVFMLNGHMLVSHKTLKTGIEQFMFRVGESNETEAFTIPGVVPMVHGGRRMTGFVFIAEDACPLPVFARLLAMSRRFVESLLPK